MKMKVLLSVIVFTLYTVSYAQNMKMIDTSINHCIYALYCFLCAEYEND